MCATFTDDDVGKTVVNANGDEIGIVSAVEHGTAHIEPDPGITDTIQAKLGWGDRDEDTYPLQDHSVSRVTDDEVRLEEDLAGVGGADAGTGAGTSDVGGDTGITDDTGVTDDSGIGDDTGITDDSGIGDDNTGITDDSGIGDDTGITDDDDDLIGNDDNDLVGDDDDDLIGDDDDNDRIGDDDDDDLL